MAHRGLKYGPLFGWFRLWLVPDGPYSLLLDARRFAFWKGLEHVHVGLQLASVDHIQGCFVGFTKYPRGKALSFMTAS